MSQQFRSFIAVAATLILGIPLLLALTAENGTSAGAGLTPIILLLSALIFFFWWFAFQKDDKKVLLGITPKRLGELIFLGVGLFIVICIVFVKFFISSDNPDEQQMWAAYEEFKAEKEAEKEKYIDNLIANAHGTLTYKRIEKDDNEFQVVLNFDANPKTDEMCSTPVAKTLYLLQTGDGKEYSSVGCNGAIGYIYKVPGEYTAKYFIGDTELDRVVIKVPENPENKVSEADTAIIDNTLPYDGTQHKTVATSPDGERTYFVELVKEGFSYSKLYYSTKNSGNNGSGSVSPQSVLEVPGVEEINSLQSWPVSPNKRYVAILSHTDEAYKYCDSGMGRDFPRADNKIQLLNLDTGDVATLVEDTANTTFENIQWSTDSTNMTVGKYILPVVKYPTTSDSAGQNCADSQELWLPPTERTPDEVITIELSD